VNESGREEGGINELKSITEEGPEEHLGKRRGGVGWSEVSLAHSFKKSSKL
jgi:hypothetical protein